MAPLPLPSRPGPLRRGLLGSDCIQRERTNEDHSLLEPRTCESSERCALLSRCVLMHRGGKGGQVFFKGRASSGPALEVNIGARMLVWTFVHHSALSQNSHELCAHACTV